MNFKNSVLRVAIAKNSLKNMILLVVYIMKQIYAEGWLHAQSSKVLFGKKRSTISSITPLNNLKPSC